MPLGACLRGAPPVLFTSRESGATLTDVAVVQVELSKHEAAWLATLAEVRHTSVESLLRLGMHRLRVSPWERQQVIERRKVDAWLEAAVEERSE